MGKYCIVLLTGSSLCLRRKASICPYCGTVQVYTWTRMCDACGAYLLSEEV